MPTDFEYRGEPVCGTVAWPVDGYVIGVQASSRSWILPLAEMPDDLPVVDQCRDRHIIRTDEHVVATDVLVRTQVYPRSVTMSEVRVIARETMFEKEPEMLRQRFCEQEVRRALEAFARRIACRLQKFGIKIIPG